MLEVTKEKRENIRTTSWKPLQKYMDPQFLIEAMILINTDRENK